jgi:hypothetical protein
MRTVLFLFAVLFASSSYGDLPIPTQALPQSKYIDQYNQRGMCPANDVIDETDYPGVKADTSFSRILGTAPYCAAFSHVDAVCKKLKDLKLWNYDSQCSAMDLMLHYYKWRFEKYRFMKFPPGPLTIAGLLNQSFSSDGEKEYINKYAHEIGFCPETDFPSEFINHSGLGNLKNHYDDANAFLTEGQASVQGNCPSCVEMAPTLSRNDWDLVSKIAMEKRSPTGAFEALDKMNQLACPSHKRVKLPMEYKFEDMSDFSFKESTPFNNKGMNPFFQVLLSGDPVVIPVWADKLSPGDERYPHSSHSALVIGAYLQKGECYYIIKNSWGMDCTRLKKEALTEDFKCSKFTGALHVTWNTLIDMINPGMPTRFLGRTPNLTSPKNKKSSNADKK